LAKRGQDRRVLAQRLRKNGAISENRGQGVFAQRLRKIGAILADRGQINAILANARQEEHNLVQEGPDSDCFEIGIWRDTQCCQARQSVHIKVGAWRNKCPD